MIERETPESPERLAAKAVYDDGLELYALLKERGAPVLVPPDILERHGFGDSAICKIDVVYDGSINGYGEDALNGLPDLKLTLFHVDPAVNIWEEAAPLYRSIVEDRGTAAYLQGKREIYIHPTVSALGDDMHAVYRNPALPKFVFDYSDTSTEASIARIMARAGIEEARWQAKEGLDKVALDERLRLAAVLSDMFSVVQRAYDIATDEEKHGPRATQSHLLSLRTNAHNFLAASTPIEYAANGQPYREVVLPYEIILERAPVAAMQLNIQGPLRVRNLYQGDPELPTWGSWSTMLEVSYPLNKAAGHVRTFTTLESTYGVTFAQVDANPTLGSGEKLEGGRHMSQEECLELSRLLKALRPEVQSEDWVPHRLRRLLGRFSTFMSRVAPPWGERKP